LDSRTTSGFSLVIQKNLKGIYFIVLAIVQELLKIEMQGLLKMVKSGGVLNHVKWKFKKLGWRFPLPKTSSQVVVPIVVETFDNIQEQQINDETPQNELVTNEPVTNEPYEVILRRSKRQRRPSISDDYVVYLQESNFDLGIDEDQVSFSQSLKRSNYIKWLDAIRRVEINES